MVREVLSNCMSLGKQILRSLLLPPPPAKKKLPVKEETGRERKSRSRRCWPSAASAAPRGLGPGGVRAAAAAAASVPAAPCPWGGRRRGSWPPRAASPPGSRTSSSARSAPSSRRPTRSSRLTLLVADRDVSEVPGAALQLLAAGLQRNGHMRAKANFSHAAGDSSTLLSFKEGDLITPLVPEARDGWHYGEGEKTKTRGWFPFSYTRALDGDGGDRLHMSLQQGQSSCTGSLLDKGDPALPPPTTARRPARSLPRQPVPSSRGPTAWLCLASPGICLDSGARTVAPASDSRSGRWHLSNLSPTGTGERTANKTYTKQKRINKDSSRTQ
ncbi:unnamed protein product [Nyctereutes procyonoides]|uniref:(raccoon dog) hypothetical protein n=1 Tax=Nyctereutes procyonoides TaxID=34880 RepID=A0A811ZGN7_NYCPR|nr:unnamed protein product [Nyctereutes procyonoides]